MIRSGRTRLGRRLRCFLSLLPCLVLASCSLADWRDECCELNMVRFRYLYRGRDRFSEYVSSVRYFLFDGSGNFLRETPHIRGCPSRVSIASLEKGGYTLVAIGNLEDYGSLTGYAQQGLEAFRLKVDDLYPSSEVGENVFCNGDRLYRGECAFTIVPGCSNSFLGEMSNVHCVLRVKVDWKLVPPFTEGYSFRLDGIGTGMEMFGDNAYSIDVHSFPPVESYGGSLVEDVQMHRFTLTATLVTLRWTDKDMPRLYFCHDGVQASKTVDLGYVFRQWGWYPSRTPVQEYEIRLLIRPDGSIEVNQGFEAAVNDWRDGGTFG